MDTDRQHARRLALLKAALLVAVVAAVGYLVYHFDFYLYLTDRHRAIRYLKSFGSLSVVVFIGLQVLQVILAPFPGEVTGFIGGYLYGAVLGTLYSTIGLTLGSWLAFSLARFFGLPLVERFVRPETVRKYDHFITHQGTLISFLLFLIPGFPKDSLCYLLGLSHMKVWVFLIVSTAGRLLGTIGLSWSGTLFRDDQHVALVVLAVAMGLAALWGYLRRDRIMHHLKRRSAPPPP